jgi:hypothetical protein
MEFNAEFVIINDGNFIIGEEGDSNHYNYKLNIVMHGNYFGK